MDRIEPEREHLRSVLRYARGAILSALARYREAGGQTRTTRLERDYIPRFPAQHFLSQTT